MGYAWATWLPAVLGSAGCQVKTYPGWESRGLAGGVFEPSAVVWHHDASGVGPSPGVPAYLIANYTTASAQLWVDMVGVWHVIGAGRAPHAGVVLAGMPNNSTSLGVETDHTTGEAWPAAQLDSLRRGTAAILARLGRDASALHFHKTICSPPGRKSDPAGLDLATERAAITAQPTPPPPPATTGDDDMQIYRDRNTGGMWLTGPGHVHPLTPEEWGTWRNLGLTYIDLDTGPLQTVLSSLRHEPVSAAAAAPVDAAAIAKAVNDDAAARLRA